MRAHGVWGGIVLVLAPWAAAGAQVTAAPGYAARRLVLPALVRGGVVRRDDVLIVGQGGDGPGLQSIVRFDTGRPTLIATGFGRLGGFDLDDDGTLYVADGCHASDAGCEASLTGDTVHAIPEALTRATALEASATALLAAGSIASPADVLFAGALGLLVSDAASAGAGRVVQASAGGAVPFVSGYDRPTGLATDGTSLYVGEAAGRVDEVIAGSSIGAFVEGLSGVVGLAFDGDGQLLVTGGFTGTGADRSGTLLAVDEAGDAVERARGFAASGDVFYDAGRDEVLVVDDGTSGVVVLCEDDDEDGVCDEDCSDGVALERAVLALRAGRTAGRGSLRMKARLRIDGGLAADPSTDGLHLQVVDAAGTVVLDAVLPADERWIEKPRERGWRYRDPAGTFAMTAGAVTLDGSDGELVKVVLKSRKRASLSLAEVTLPLRATLTLDAAGECGSSAFAACRASDGGSIRCR
jgi:hypothetical protein